MFDELIARENHLLQKKYKDANYSRPQHQINPDEAWLFKENRDIYEQYVDIVSKSGEHQLEALKRAVFFQWFAVSEPPFLSYINDLRPELQLFILERLQNLIQGKQLDLELENMVAWYYWITDWYFDSFPRLSILLIYLKEVSQHCKPLEYFKEHSNFNNRGQMGQYWQSLFAK